MKEPAPYREANWHVMMMRSLTEGGVACICMKYSKSELNSVSRVNKIKWRHGMTYNACKNYFPNPGHRGQSWIFLHRR